MNAGALQLSYTGAEPTILSCDPNQTHVLVPETRDPATEPGGDALQRHHDLEEDVPQGVDAPWLFGIHRKQSERTEKEEAGGE